MIRFEEFYKNMKNVLEAIVISLTFKKMISPLIKNSY